MQWCRLNLGGNWRRGFQCYFTEDDTIELLQNGEEMFDWLKIVSVLTSEFVGSNSVRANRIFDKNADIGMSVRFPIQVMLVICGSRAVT